MSLNTLSSHASSGPDAPAAANDGASFAALGLPGALCTALTRRGITAPFPIQAATLPDALAGRDVLGRGQTGSGKTLAFGLPSLARLQDGSTRPKKPRGLVLVPTRELALQVCDALEPLAHTLGLKVRPVIGGAPFGKQREALSRGVDLLVATPGRLTDLIEQRLCSLADVEIVVLDEADHMADMGFMPAVTKLLDQVPSGGQRLLFSATLDREVDKLVRRYLVDPVTHSTAPPAAAVATMEHHLLVVRQEDKLAVSARIAAREGRTIMFVRTKHGADRLAKQLGREGVAAGSLHGGKTQGQRNRTLDAFRSGRVPVLVATDVAARGIHVDDVSLVVHVDPPADPKDYLHRAGRTARAGESGVVITLVLPNQQRTVEAMARKAGVVAERVRVRPDDHALVDLAGAREPSGVPVVVATPAPQKSKPAGRRPRSRAGAPRKSGGGAGGRGRGARHSQASGARSGGGKPRSRSRRTAG